MSEELQRAAAALGLEKYARHIFLCADQTEAKCATREVTLASSRRSSNGRSHPTLGEVVHRRQAQRQRELPRPSSSKARARPRPRSSGKGNPARSAWNVDLPAAASRSLPLRQRAEAPQGQKNGDRVIIYMPMIPEAAIAMLACARIGAVHSVVFGGFSAESVQGPRARQRRSQDGHHRRWRLPSRQASCR
jgi:hypothetical protein